MPEITDLQQISIGVNRVRQTIQYVTSRINSFKLIDEELVPEGLKPIARSMSWLVEQIVVQNIRKYKDASDIISVTDPPHSLLPYDCAIAYRGDSRPYFVNVKTSLDITRSSGRSDVSKAPSLVKFYEEHPGGVLVVAIVKVSLQRVRVTFRNPIVFNVAWTPDPYYNRANHNLQSICNGTQNPRTSEEFVQILRDLMEEAGHGGHY